MAASTSTFRIATSLRLGERVLTRCDDGILLAEYALFDVSDIVLRATDPVTVREVGYMTTAGDALERLDRAGISLDLAVEAAGALPPEVSVSYARGTAARSLAARLGAYELFDGAIFSASAQRYEGAWLDLRALAGALTLPEPVAGSAAMAIQILHLCAALSEVERSTTLHLATAAATRHRRPGERTHQRVPLEAAQALPEALRKLAPLARPAEVEPARDRLLRQALLARVRERSGPETSPESRSRLASLEASLSLKTMPLGPLTDPELRALERRLAGGQLEGVEADLERLEHTHGRIPGLRYLRARAALLRGDEPPRSVAQSLSELAEENKTFHEAALVAARTWLVAGEEAHARYFARRLFDDPSAGDSERLVALEILEATSTTERSFAPPAVRLHDAMPPLPQARVPAFGPPLAEIPPPRNFPPEGWSQRPAPNSSVPRRSFPPEVPAPVTQRSPPPPLPSRAHLTPPPSPPLTPPPPLLPPRPSPRSSPPPPRPSPRPPPPPPASPAPPPPASAPSPPQGVPPAPYDAELVETLALPFGASESTLGLSEMPRTPLQARIALTRLARDLARDYRLGYGKTLRCNVLAIDAMQQHLTHRFGGAPLSDPGVTWELRRHGALLSEIIARALGGTWVDIAPTEPGFWAMTLYPSIRTFPIGRVYRFIALGHRERDLVGYYLELESQVRKAAAR